MKDTLENLNVKVNSRKTILKFETLLYLLYEKEVA